MGKFKWYAAVLVFFIIIFIGIVKVNIECTNRSTAIQEDVEMNRQINKNTGNSSYYESLYKIQDNTPLKIFYNTPSDIKVYIKEYEINFSKSSFKDSKDAILNSIKDLKHDILK